MRQTGPTVGCGVEGRFAGGVSVAAVIRSAGERTTSACRELVEQVLPSDRIAVLEERPFEKALRRTCEVGIEFGCDWTLVLDADVLCSPSRIERLIQQAIPEPESVFLVQARILDKLTGMVREAGQRLYRTSLLEQALACIPEQGKQIRPECYTVKAMEARGFPWRHRSDIIGLHDYEQFYRDVHRKGYLYARKHTQWLDRIVPFWRENSGRDPDFLIALHGMWHGLSTTAPTLLDIRTLPTQIDSLLEHEGLTEKPSLSPMNISAQTVEELLATHPAVVEAECPAPARFNQIYQQLSRKRSEIGWWNVAPYAVGWSLERIGRRMQKWVNQPLFDRSIGN